MKRKSIIEIVCSILAIISLIIMLIFSYNKNINNFLYKGVKKIFYPFSKIKVSKLEKEKLKKDEELVNKLKEENLKLKADLENKKALESEVTRLYELLNIKNKYKAFDIIPCKKIDSFNNNFSSNIEINVGKKQGIKENMMVLCSTGLYGKIISVADNTSKVQKISDPINKMAVYINEKKVEILGKGKLDESDKLELDLIPNNYQIPVDGNVYTWGNDVFSEGIYVGKISKIIENKESGRKKAEVIVNYNGEHITNLVVIKK